MVPFLSDGLEELLRSLMKVIVKQVLEEASTALSLTKIDVAKSSNQLEVEQVKLGTALKESLSSMESRSEQKRAFKRKCKQVIIVLIQKLQERCPLKYSIVRNSSSLSPNSMVEEKKLSKMKFQGLVERLCKLKWLTTDEADDAKEQFDEFVDIECPKHRESSPVLTNYLMLLMFSFPSLFTKFQSTKYFGRSVGSYSCSLMVRVL